MVHNIARCQLELHISIHMIKGPGLTAFPDRSGKGRSDRTGRSGGPLMHKISVMSCWLIVEARNSDLYNKVLVLLVENTKSDFLAKIYMASNTKSDFLLTKLQNLMS